MGQGPVLYFGHRLQLHFPQNRAGAGAYSTKSMGLSDAGREAGREGGEGVLLRGLEVENNAGETSHSDALT